MTDAERLDRHPMQRPQGGSKSTGPGKCMFRSWLHSRATRRRMCCCLGTLALLSGINPIASEAQSSVNCHDDSVPKTSIHASKTAQGAETGTAEPPYAHGIRLSWDASTAPPASIKGYYIFRRESGPSCQSPKNKCEILNPSTPIRGTRCTDYAVLPGHTYIYEAQTIGVSAVVSQFSNEAKATAR